MKSGRRFIYIVGLVACLGVSGRATAQVIRADISSNQAMPGETLTLFVTLTNPTKATAPTPPKTSDFDIRLASVTPTQQQSFQISNGVSSSKVNYTYRYLIRPLKQGSLELPPFTFKDSGVEHATNTIRIFVGAQRADGPYVFCEIKAPRDSVYVGEPVKLALEIWIRVYSQRGIGKLEPKTMWYSLRDQSATSWGVFKHADINQPNYRPDLRADSNGIDQEYYVYILESVVYPTSPGPLNVGDIQFVYQYPISLVSTMLGASIERARTITATPESPNITVKPLPSKGRPPDFNGAVGRYTISAKAKPTRVPVGDPITLTLTIESSAPLERLLAPALDRVTSLTRDFEVSTDNSAGLVESGQKHFAITLRALREDVKIIPPIPLSFFDPELQAYETVHSDPIPLTVLPTQRLALPAPGEGGVVLAPSTATPLLENNEGLQANFVNADELLANQAPAGGGTLAAVLIGMPTIYLIAGLVQARTARLRNNTALRRRTQALRTARKVLESGSVLTSGQIRAALLRYVADCTNVASAGLTHDEAVRLVSQRGASSELVASLDQLLEVLDQAEYGGGVGLTADAAQQSSKLITELESSVFS